MNEYGILPKYFSVKATDRKDPVMKEIFALLAQFEKDLSIYTVLLRIILAVLFGGIIGNERGKHGRQAGLRTHVLVCLGSAMTALTGVYASEILGFGGDPFRIAAQVVSGIGFLGAGMIIVKSGNAITGLTTAAGLWATATIGIALGVGFYIGAILVTLACVFTAAFLTRVERKRKHSIHIYIEIDDLKQAGHITEHLREMFHHDCYIEVLQAKSGMSGNLGIYLTIPYVKDVSEHTEKINDLVSVVYTIVES